MKKRIRLLTFLFLSFVGLATLTAYNNMPEPSESEDPLTLQSIMRLISANMGIINEGIYTEDYHLIEEGAAAINDHPPLSPVSLELVKSTLGPRMQAFQEYDNIVHGHADTIKVAAQQKNMQKVLDSYQIVQKGCVSCHAAFRNEIVKARIMKD